MSIKKQMSIVNIKLKYARKKKQLTVLELATISKLTSFAIEEFETGSKNPSSDALKRLAEALGTTTEFLLGKSPVF